MFSILCTELLKLKRQMILILSPVCALITALSGYINWYIIRREFGLGVDWSYLFPMTEEVATNGLLIMFIVCFSIFTFLNEYQNSCHTMLFSYSSKCYRFIIVKLLISFTVCIITVYTTYAFTCILGFISIHELPNYFIMLYHLKMFFVIAIMCFALAPLFILIAVLSRSYVLPMVAIILILVWNSTLILNNNSVSVTKFLPWSVPNIIIQSLQLYLNPAYRLIRISEYAPYLLSIAITFIIPLVFLFFYFNKSQHARNN